MAAVCPDAMSYSNETIHEWFAAQVWSGRERHCATHLRVRGYEVFLPCYTERRRWSDRVKVIERALFAGYVFCRSEADVLAQVITAPGVIRIVGDGQRPLPIPTDEIESIQRIVASGVAATPWPFMHEGQHVRIDVGPLRGTHGRILRTKTDHRLIVSISLLQRSVAVELDADWVSVPPALIGDVAISTAPHSWHS
jgi:transcription antitermination factor NusG